MAVTDEPKGKGKTPKLDQIENLRIARAERAEKQIADEKKATKGKKR